MTSDSKGFQVIFFHWSSEARGRRVSSASDFFARKPPSRSWDLFRKSLLKHKRPVTEQSGTQYANFFQICDLISMFTFCLLLVFAASKRGVTLPKQEWRWIKKYFTVYHFPVFLFRFVFLFRCIPFLWLFELFHVSGLVHFHQPGKQSRCSRTPPEKKAKTETWYDNMFMFVSFENTELILCQLVWFRWSAYLS